MKNLLVGIAGLIAGIIGLYVGLYVLPVIALLIAGGNIAVGLKEIYD